MKIKKPKSDNSIKCWSSHTVNEDDITGELEIESFEIKFEGNLSEWIEEYLKSPVKSRLHKNLVRIFSDWFEE